MTNTTKIYVAVTACILILAYGCSGTIVPLKGSYSDNTVVLNSAKPVDSVWSILQKLFLENGLPIKKIDKKNGLLLTEKIPANATYSFEDTSGNLQQAKAWVVLRKSIVNKKEWQLKTIYGEWSIDVVEDGPGKTRVEINPIVLCTYFPNGVTSMESQGQSTGRMEALLEPLLATR